MPVIKKNCGIAALEGFLSIDNISMYTIIQLAKDNGITLYFCKADKDKLPLVARPAILHAEGHFVLAQDGVALPEENYTGWVLTQKPFGTPLPYSLAKQLHGKKKGGDILGPIVVGLASVVNPILGAFAGAAFGGYQAFGGPGVTAKPGEWWRIPIGGALGYLGGQAPGGSTFGIGNVGLAAGLGGLQNLPGAIKSGNYGSVLTGALGAGLGNKFTTGAVGGLASGSGTGLIGNATDALKGGLGAFGFGGGTGSTGALGQQGVGGKTALTGLSGTQASTPAMSLIGGGVGNAAGSQLPGTGAAFLAGSAPAASSGGLSSIFGGSGSSSGGLLGKLGLSGGDLLKGGAALALGQIAKPPEYTPDTLATYDKASQYLKGASLPTASTTQLNRWLGMPIADIKSELITPQATNAAMLELDKKYQDALTQVQRLAANSGQSYQTSSDVQNQVNEINRQWADAKANLQATVEQNATLEAINIKKWSVEQSLQQGRFDINSAMELAAMMGRDQELMAAIQQDNYEAFQDIIGDILGMNYGGGGSGQQSSGLSSILGV